jgi:hypothetical protein
MRRLCALLLVAWFGTTGKAAAEVRLTIHDGRVTLEASHATVAEILSEWSKVGQTQIVNGELVAGEPISLELTDLPEEQALDVVLRSVAGYITLPRPAGMVAPSLIDRILILPTSTPPRVPAPTEPAPVPQRSEYQHYSQYPQYPSVPPGIDDAPVLATPNPSGAVGAPYPAYPAYQQPPPAPASAARPGGDGSAGSRVPGQMPPGAPVPGVPVQPTPRTPPTYPSNPIQNP